MAVTIRDVAKAAQVSKSAVSFALNNRPGVSDSTREHILRVADQLGWKPSVRAKSLAVSKSFAVAMVITRPAHLLGSDPFFPMFIMGLQESLAVRGYVLVLRIVEHLDDEQREYERLAREGRADGFILMDVLEVDPRIDLLTRLGLPAVTLGRPGTPSPFPSVSVDEGPPIRECLRLLIGLGRQRIAHVGGPQSTVRARQHREAWAGALADAGLVADLFAATDEGATSAVSATNTVLDSGATAIVYSNLITATAGMAVVHRRGLRIPQDVAITGFDCTEFAAYLTPSLTTVHTDPAYWGSCAANALVDLICGTPVEDDQWIPTPRLVLRASTA